jgi:hypothetical protein
MIGLLPIVLLLVLAVGIYLTFFPGPRRVVAILLIALVVVAVVLGVLVG